MFSPFRNWGYVQGVQHVTIGITPSFGTDPTCKTLNRFKFCMPLESEDPKPQLHIQDWGGGMPHIDALESPYRSINKICDRECQFAVWLWNRL